MKFQKRQNRPTLADSTVQYCTNVYGSVADLDLDPDPSCRVSLDLDPYPYKKLGWIWKLDPYQMIQI